MAAAGVRIDCARELSREMGWAVLSFTHWLAFRAIPNKLWVSFPLFLSYWRPPMRKIVGSLVVVSAALVLVGCPRFHSECQGGEWGSTTVTYGSSSTSNASSSRGSGINGSSTDSSRGCKFWLCRDGYLRQDNSCVQSCDTDEYAPSGRWCVRKCPKGQWAKDDACVAACGTSWFYKEDSHQCVQWCEKGYNQEGQKCVKPAQQASSPGQPRTL